MADESLALATTAIDIVFGGLAGAIVSYGLGARRDRKLEQRQLEVSRLEATRDDLLNELTWSYQLAESGRPPTGLRFGAAAYPDADRRLIGDQAVADECLAVMEAVFQPRVANPLPLTEEERIRLAPLLERLTSQFRAQIALARRGKEPARCRWPI